MPILSWQFQTTTTEAPAPIPGVPGVAAASNAQVVVFVPTAINVCLAVAENIVANLRKRQAGDLALPSLYKRAYLVAYETDEVAVVRAPSR